MDAVQLLSFCGGFRNLKAPSSSDVTTLLVRSDENEKSGSSLCGRLWERILEMATKEFLLCGPKFCNYILQCQNWESTLIRFQSISPKDCIAKEGCYATKLLSHCPSTIWSEQFYIPPQIQWKNFPAYILELGTLPSKQSDTTTTRCREQPINCVFSGKTTLLPPIRMYIVHTHKIASHETH
ncbi:hypothetical protein CEXT_133601 [Caerostris extrusa]|uniref:Uncharacterized protein n=1 Tax=Caerostris extrusa TaxID=172846 RepID=A0AAV4NBQ3_CAEEX|nr:hypothetical protein CEXT_133601 [Caerostris extrusa]